MKISDYAYDELKRWIEQVTRDTDAILELATRHFEVSTDRVIVNWPEEFGAGGPRGALGMHPGMDDEYRQMLIDTEKVLKLGDNIAHLYYLLGQIRYLFTAD